MLLLEEVCILLFHLFPSSYLLFCFQCVEILRMKLAISLATYKKHQILHLYSQGLKIFDHFIYKSKFFVSFNQTVFKACMSTQISTWFSNWKGGPRSLSESTNERRVSSLLKRSTFLLNHQCCIQPLHLCL